MHNSYRRAAVRGGLAILFAASPMAASAAVTVYSADLLPLNNSGVTGTATVTLQDLDFMTVNISATGLTPNQIHPQHIHGVLNGNSVIPTLAQDTDRDGFIEVVEGAATYGPILMNLTSPPGTVPGGFPTAPGGVINFTQTYNLNDPVTFSGVAPPLGVSNPNKSLLFPLENRHIVIHGANVAGGAGAGTPGEIDGTPGYKLVLPVANGEFVLSRAVAPIPEPGTIGLLAAGLVGLSGYVRRRRATITG